MVNTGRPHHFMPMNSNITQQEVLQFLKAIETGAVVLQPELDPQEVYAGNVPYAANNGWHITIFNDANEWDYVESIQTADGRVADFEDIDDMPAARQYAPSDDIAWLRYGIPGYGTFRCTKCGIQLTEGPPYPRPFVCGPCRSKFRIDETHGS